MTPQTAKAVATTLSIVLDSIETRLNEIGKDIDYYATAATYGEDDYNLYLINCAKHYELQQLRNEIEDMLDDLALSELEQELN